MLFFIKNIMLILFSIMKVNRDKNNRKSALCQSSEVVQALFENQTEIYSLKISISALARS